MTRITDELDGLYQTFTRSLTEHMEAFAAAYFKTTGIDPRDAVLCCVQDGYNYKFYFRRRDPLPDHSREQLIDRIAELTTENARLTEALALLGVPANAEILDIIKIIANLAQMRGLAGEAKEGGGRGMTDKPKHVYYECPNCNYVISDTIKFYARYDYPCPRCNARRYSEFFVSSFKYEPPEEQPEEGPDASDR